MKSDKTFTVRFRRKREGKTDYHNRLRLLSSGKPRLVIRKSLRHIFLQVVEFDSAGDKVLFSASSSELRKHGWKGYLSNTSAAYLTGLLLASKMKSGDVVPDIGMYVSTKGSVVYAAIKGVADGGVNVPVSDSVVPDESRIRGEHVAALAKKLKDDKAKYDAQFSKYVEAGLDPERLPEHFDDIKKKLGGK